MAVSHDFTSSYLPQRVNAGPWLTAYTLNELRARIESARLVLPVCPLGTDYQRLASLGDFVLPPLFHQAMDADLRSSLLQRISECFPYYHGGEFARRTDAALEIVELTDTPAAVSNCPRVVAFSVDTAVEEHGPHLPLCTDTIQSYSVLRRLEQEFDEFVIGPPVEYGHLTWGLPFGLSIDITPELLTRYVTGFTNAVLEWLQPEAIYVVDVHGSIVHRQSIIAGLQESQASKWAFRWLHEPLVEFASERGDQHAGGVETALVELAGTELIDRRWFPDRIDEIEAGEMSLEQAVELTVDLSRFVEFAETHPVNGIIGTIRNYNSLDASVMFESMLAVARQDVESLLDGRDENIHQIAGDSPWERDKQR